MKKKPFLLASILFLATTQFASAVITNPYTLDEKAQVVFGDSVQIVATSTYYGLENYTHDYVGNYLHITFTYTHHRCCYASYPPLFYVTAHDPRSTTTPLIRDQQAIYQLQAIPVPPGHDTDWYLYDIQFDATGYTATITQGGVTATASFHRDITGITMSDWVSLANLSPSQGLHFSMAFTPLPIRDNLEPPEPAKPDPVIIIPGIMGSAYKNGLLLIDPILHTYDDLIATLDENGYERGADLFTFPYEWRDSNVFTANLLDDKIDEVKTICQCDKVDLVAHSMGGLVARAYIQSGDYDQDVDQVIFLGTPHKGAPKAYLQWEGGQFESESLDNILTHLFFGAEAIKNGYSTVFSYIRNRPILSVQELLPTFNYLEDKDTGVVRNYPDNYPQNHFLESLNTNISTLLSSGVAVTNIIGNSGSETIERIRVTPSTRSGLWEHGEPDGFYAILGDHGLERGYGDNTAALSGATLDGIISEEVSVSHSRIPTVAAVKIFNILTNKTASTTYDNGFGLDTKVLLLQLLSPIDVVVTAPDGKRVGKNFTNGGEYDEIRGAFYSGYERDEEYIVILNPLDGEYKMEVQGTDTGGRYGVLTSYASEATSTTKEISGLTSPGQITTLSVVVDNEHPEAVSPEKVITLEVLTNDINKAYELGWIKDKRLKDRLLTLVRSIIKIEKKPGKPARIEKRIDRRLALALRVELQGYKRDKINTEAYNIIKADLEWLINNN